MYFILLGSVVVSIVYGFDTSWGYHDKKPHFERGRG